MKKNNVVLGLFLSIGITAIASAVTPDASATVSSNSALKVPQVNAMPSMVERRDLIQSMPNAIVFNLGESKVNPQFAPILSWNASYIQAFPAAKIKIVGNADDFKNAAKDEALGLERAQNIRTILFTMGVPYENTEVVSLGNTKPVYKKNSDGHQPRNQRVDIFYTENAPAGYTIDKVPVVKTDTFEQAVIPMPIN